VDEDVLEERTDFVPAYPNLRPWRRPVSGEEFPILPPGAGNTPGDLVMRLPQEKILASGDIVVWPVPYGHGGRSQEWARTRRNRGHGFCFTHPGHGDVQTDRDYLELLAATLDSVSSQMTSLCRTGHEPVRGQGSAGPIVVRDAAIHRWRHFFGSAFR
jgi:glyoxylase-like metal-dependent hydrolase (beta-lactamase superfamily II)